MYNILRKIKWKVCLFCIHLFPNKYAVAFYSLAGIKIGKGTVISKNTFFHNDKVSFGNNCYINKHCKFYTGMSTDGHVTICNNVNCGMNVMFICTTHEIGKMIRAGKDISKEIVIEDGCWIGGGTIILPGVHVGRASIIGAGSVVTKDVAANTLVAGNPAKVVRKLTE